MEPPVLFDDVTPEESARQERELEAMRERFETVMATLALLALWLGAG